MTHRTMRMRPIHKQGFLEVDTTQNLLGVNRIDKDGRGYGFWESLVKGISSTVLYLGVDKMQHINLLSLLH